MTLNYDRAWQDTLQSLRSNRTLLALTAGVFFFLPYMVLALALPDSGQVAVTDEAAMAAFQQAMLDKWWLLLVVGVLQAMGTLGIISLLRRRDKPTLGQALGHGLRLTLPFLGAQVLMTAMFVFVAFLGALGAALFGAPILRVVLMAASFFVIVVIAVRLSLVAAVMAVEDLRNVPAALNKSWRLVDGNTARLFGFYALLIAAYVVLSAILTMIFGLGLALLDERLAAFGSALVTAATSAVMGAVMAAVAAAVHRQLTRPGSQAEAEG